MSANLNIATALALFSWPIVALWLYSTRPIGRATLWTILGGYLLLPVGAFIKFDMIPPFDKTSIPSFAALFCCMIVLRRSIRLTNGFGLAEVLLLMFLISSVITSALNNDQVVMGGAVLPGVGVYDGGSALISRLVLLIPFFLGRQILREEADTADILRVLVVAGLAYSLPMLFELRMSPQLHNWIYGYHPTAFFQQMRDEGFRPVVFVGHGLTLALLIMMVVVAAAALWRTQKRIAQFPLAGVTAYLGGVLVLCKTLSALTYAAALVPLVRWASPRLQLRVAILLVAVALSYPLLRKADLVPTTLMVSVADSIDAERAASLQTRFTWEQRLLDRASERFWFGWGRYGRSHIYDDTGRDVTLPDGRWIIVMGEFGFFGFLAEFGLLAFAVFRAAAAFRYAQSVRDRTLGAALALIVAISITNLLPNSAFSPYAWLMVGALLGRAEALAALARQRRPLHLRSNASVIGR